MARLASTSFAMTVLLGLLTAVGPLSTDMYLPSLPSIARYFGVAPGDAQLTLSAYLTGFAIGLPFYGPLSDRKGRKPVLLVGMALFVASNAFAAMSQDLPTLIACRVVQGFGAAGPAVIARALVRDLHEGRRAAQELARMGSIMAIVPAIAPVVGVGLEIGFGWRASFVFAMLISLLLAVVTLVKLPETLQTRLETPFSAMEILRGFSGLIGDRRFLPHAGVAAATFSGLFAFISGSSFLYQGHFRQTSLEFAFTFVAVVLGYMSGGLVSGRLAMRHRSQDLLLLGSCLQCGGGLIMIIGLWLWPGLPWAMTGAMMLYASGVGFSLPQSMASAMMPFPEQSGTVSSLLSIVQTGVAALVGAIVGRLIPNGPIVLGLAIFLCGLAALGLQPLVRASFKTR